MTFLGMQASVFAAGEKSTMKLRWSYQVAPQVLQEFCNDSFYTVSILKNSKNQIGGYVLQPAIGDAPIPYLDCDGKPLVTFHIFGTDDEKETAMKTISPLRKLFPIEEALDCLPKKANK